MTPATVGVGWECGLFDVLIKSGEQTIAGLAEQSECDARYEVLWTTAVSSGALSLSGPFSVLYVGIELMLCGMF